MKILIVDDMSSNLGVLTLLIEEWFENHDIDDDNYEIDVAYNGQIALDKVKEDNYVLMFLDIMMPIMDGFEALEKIREIKSKEDIKIVMVTALADGDTKLKTKKLGANAYVTKPVDFNMVNAMLDRYVLSEILIEQNEEGSDFDDFEDFDDFDDFDDFEDNQSVEQKNMMNQFNESHKKVPAVEFLEDYPDLEYILEDLSDLSDDINYIIDYLDSGSLEKNLENISHIFKEYARFLNTFIDFYELSSSIAMINELILNMDLSLMESKHIEFVTEFIKAILKDLENWKDHVFIEQDAVDVFYINASSLNSCLQLEAFIKEHN